MLLGGNRTLKVAAEEQLVLVQHRRGAYPTVHKLPSLFPHDGVQGKHRGSNGARNKTLVRVWEVSLQSLDADEHLCGLVIALSAIQSRHLCYCCASHEWPFTRGCVSRYPETALQTAMGAFASAHHERENRRNMQAHQIPKPARTHTTYLTVALGALFLRERYTALALEVDVASHKGVSLGSLRVLPAEHRATVGWLIN